MSSKEIMLNIVVEEFKDENIHIMTNECHQKLCSKSTLDELWLFMEIWDMELEQP